jgi:hypothetical protein
MAIAWNKSSAMKSQRARKLHKRCSGIALVWAA